MSNHTLIFTQDNPCNTQLADSETNRVLYYVETDFPDETKKEKAYTRVMDSNRGVLATLEWKGMVGGNITLKDGNSQSMSSWLKRSMVPFVNTVSFKDDTDRKYKWDNFAAGVSLQLFANDSSDKMPIARFVKSRRPVPPQNVSESAKLLMSPRAYEICDLVVITFLFLEKDRRQKDQDSNALPMLMHSGWTAS